MTNRINRRHFVWLCLGSAGAACLTLTGCDGGVAAEEVTTEPAATSSAPTDMPTVAPGAAAATVVPVQQPDDRASGSCPRRMVNDPYPGRCRLYVDKDGDGICDLSQPA